MKRGQPDVKKLYSAIVQPKGDRTTTLSEEIQRRFESKLEGIQLPKDSRSRKRFVEFTGGIFQNLRGSLSLERLKKFVNLKMVDALVENELEIMEEKLDRLKEIIDICSKSSRQMRYLQFMGRPDFDIETFIHSVHIFTGGREISFEELPQERIDTGMGILHLLKDDSDESLKRLISVLDDALKTNERFQRQIADFPNDPSVQEWMPLQMLGGTAVALGNDFEKVLEVLTDVYPNGTNELYEIIEHAEEEENPFLIDDTVAHDFLLDYGIYLDREGVFSDEQFVSFHKSFRIGRLKGFVISNPELLQERGFQARVNGLHMMVASDYDYVVQHELQHLFDNLASVDGSYESSEYRAYLAEIAFQHNDIRARILLRYSITSTAEEDSGKHSKAAEKVVKEMKRLNSGKEFRSGKRVRNLARKLLNREYREACGLTYDEILEPFRKDLNP